MGILIEFPKYLSEANRDSYPCKNCLLCRFPSMIQSLLLVHLWEKTIQLAFQDRLLRFPDFQFSRFRVCIFFFEKYVGEISRNN